MAENKTRSFLDNLKKAAAAQKNYGVCREASPPVMDAAACPNCGAGRAKQDGLTRCAYCGHRFLDVELDDGIYLTKEDNSRHG
jgi:DNA-directed RNA polymerase subunit RPC12/RpoP